MASELAKLWNVQIGRPTISSWEPGTPIIEEAPSYQLGQPTFDDSEPPPGARWKMGPPVIEQQQPSARQPSGSSAADQLISRVWTQKDAGNADAGEGFLPAAALRPEVRSWFQNYGGASMIDVRDLSPEETKLLRLWVDPAWYERQRNPGAGLSDAERAEALRRAKPR